MTTPPPPPPPKDPSKPDTLYPKITASAKDLLSTITHYQFLYPELPPIESIKLTGTVKLHGMHTDIVISHTNTIRLQSRNQHSLALLNDVQGFASKFLPLTQEILALKRKIIKRFKELNPSVAINEEFPLIIAGEWIGPGIQKKVAISDLPEKLFVIISLNINNLWVGDEPYADISDEKNGIYSISTSGFYHHTLPIEGAKDSLAILQPLADKAEEECPFGKKFGILGRGEGIVWKPEEPWCYDAKTWIKMKGPISRVRPVAEKKIGVGNDEYARSFAGSVVGEMRLEQGWMYLEEMGLEKGRIGVVGYLKWLVGDVLAEEGKVIKGRGIEWGIVRKEVERMGREWYLSKVKEVEMEKLVLSLKAGSLDVRG